VADGASTNHFTTDADGWIVGLKVRDSETLNRASENYDIFIIAAIRLAAFCRFQHSMFLAN